MTNTEAMRDKVEGQSASENQEKYNSFDDWFLEVENYGTRSERFYTLLGHYSIGDNLGLTTNLIVWLKAAYEAGAGESKKLPPRGLREELKKLNLQPGVPEPISNHPDLQKELAKAIESGQLTIWG